MPANELTALADRLQREDPNYFLGRLFWYSLADVRVPQTECARMLRAAGFSATPPPMPKDLDVFKRVCTATKRDKIATAEPDVFENYLLVPFRDDKMVTRRVVRQMVDNKGRKLGHDELIDIIFDRATSAIRTERVGTAVCHGMCKDIVGQIVSEFALWQGCLTTYAVREWIRNHILHLGATMVRPGGGVYFLKEALQPQIEGLEKFGLELNASGHGKIDFHSLPLIDDRKQREMVQRAFEAETVGALDTLMIEVATYNRDGAVVTADKYKALFATYRELMGKTQDYEALLEQKLASTGNRLELFQDALLQLSKHIKE